LAGLLFENRDGNVTNFVWDWASGIPEMLSDGDNLYLLGHDTLGCWGASFGLPLHGASTAKPLTKLGLTLLLRTGIIK
jgi:hypothetical protein